jgi:DNA modification methylase
MAEKAYTDGRLLVGNCLETLKTLEDNSIDSIVTDPPYELGFMGKSWDSTGIAFNTAIWQECLRVLKPGGHLLAFSGSRTYHRMAVAIEDAGFEIRDQIMWIYGSGFPKSLDISKAIDKSAGVKREKVTKVGKVFTGSNNNIAGVSGIYEADSSQSATKEAKQWQGWGTALKPAHEPIVVARKPLIGTVAETVLKYGTGGINIDASRVGTENTKELYRKPTEYNDITPNAGMNASKIRGSVTDDYLKGRFPANVILTHNHDCQETGTVTDDITLNGEGNDKLFHGNFNGGQDQSPKKATTTTWSCTPGCPATQFPNSKSTGGRIGKKDMGNITNVPAGEYETGDPGYGDNGTAARFFYCAKASKKERNGGLDGLPTTKIVTFQTGNGASGKASSISEGRDTQYKNFHPTVKPIELMKYLIKLVTPPKGTVLDPFLGSGTTAVAAVLEGFDWKGCEMTEDYLPIIKGRVNWALKEKKKEQPKLL